MTMTIEKEAGNAWNRLRAEIDELNSKGTEPPVYRAALTLPLTQAGITAVVGAIAEFPSGFTLFLLNTGGAGEVFLICAIDGVWRVWTVTPSSGGMPLIDPAVVNNFALQNADGSLYNAGFGAGAVGEDLLTAVDVDGAREVLGLAPVALPPKQVNHVHLPYSTTNTGSGTSNVIADYITLSSGTTASSTARRYVNTNTGMIGMSIAFVNWQRLNVFNTFVRILTTNPEGVIGIYYGKRLTEPLGSSFTGSAVGYIIENNVLVSGVIANAGASALVALTPPGGSINGRQVTIMSENGTVRWYVDGVLAGESGAGPAVNAVGTLSFEISNGVTAAGYAINFWSQSTHY